MMKTWLVRFAIVAVAWIASVGAETPSKASPPIQAADTPAVKAALARIEKLHGSIKRNADNQVIAVDLFECQTTNADVGQLVKSLPDLVALTLWGAEIDDQGAKQLAALTHLTELTLENTDIHDDTLKSLQSLSKLKVLALRHSSYLTDQALGHLKGYPSLQVLRLLYNNFDDDGMAQLAGIKNLPGAGHPRLRHRRRRRPAAS